MITGPVTGIILAGGESKRMGSHKALAIWRGRRLIEWVYDALKPLCTEILIVVNEGDFSFLDARVITDNFHDVGPAAGIESGLKASKTGTSLIVSCDTPVLSTDFFRYLLDNHGNAEISLSEHDGINEPLIGVYDRNVQVVFEKALQEGRVKPPEIIRTCRWQEIRINPGLDFYRGDLFLNLNTPNDLSS